jgi:cytidylate kinase
LIIAIDGPAAAGKGTLARKLAHHFDFAYLDTGSLYRAVGLSVLRAGAEPSDQGEAIRASKALDVHLLVDPDLRAEATAAAASCVATMPKVRDNLLEFQQKFAMSPPDGKKGAVLDGRDIGTVVCPDADVKLFVSASADVRARRRYDELKARGESVEFAQILLDVEARDAQDRDRKDAPLRPAEDALLLDTTELDIDAVFLRAVTLASERM